jgi:hypothetical protein
MTDTTSYTIRFDVIRSVRLLVGVSFIGAAAVLLAAVVTDASFAQLTLAAAGPPALAGAILLGAFHGLKGPAAVACAALGVFGVGFIAGLNDWVFAHVVARVAMAGTGVTLLGWGLARAIERPDFSWKALRGFGVPSVVSGGLLTYGDADWVGEPRPGHVRVQVGPDSYVAGTPERVERYLKTGRSDLESPSDPAEATAIGIAAVLPWWLVAPLTAAAGLILLGAAVPSPAEASADVVATAVLGSWDVVLFAFGLLVAVAEFMRGHVGRGLLGALGVVLLVAVGGWPI